MDKIENNVRDVFHSAIRIEVHRDNLFEDSFTQLSPYSRELKQPVKISFISEQGTQVCILYYK
jgi:hypothetical protein